MTGNKNIFLDMDTNINSQVKMGHGDLVNVKGKGTIGIQTKVGSKYIYKRCSSCTSLGAKFVECGTTSRAWVQTSL